ncbi:MAG: globin domain-containing protein [Gammaproteobacteria bacterium]|nr:globin domain-containing protein [Gammaproteobacteria bacterium]
MTADEIKRLQQSWAAATVSPDKFTEKFYANVFELDPELRTLFRRSMGMQGKKLYSMFSTVVDYMGESQRYIVPLVAAGRRHTQYGIKEKDFETVRQALMKTLADELKDGFDAETRLVWEMAYNTIATVMRSSLY